MKKRSIRTLRQNDCLRTTVNDLKERGYEVICINLDEMTPSEGYKPKPLSEIVSAKYEDQ